MTEERETRKDFSEAEEILNRAASNLAPKENGSPWKRTIQISEEVSGVVMKEKTVVLSDSVAFSGNPLDLLKRIFSLASDFDRREEEERKRAVEEAKKEADYWLGFLHRHLSPDEYQEVVEELIWR